MFVSISQVIGCEDRLRNELYSVEWGVKLYSNQPTHPPFCGTMEIAPNLAPKNVISARIRFIRSRTALRMKMGKYYFERYVIANRSTLVQ